MNLIAQAMTKIESRDVQGPRCRDAGPGGARYTDPRGYRGIFRKFFLGGLTHCEKTCFGLNLAELSLNSFKLS